MEKKNSALHKVMRAIIDLIADVSKCHSCFFRDDFPCLCRHSPVVSDTVIVYVNEGGCCVQTRTPAEHMLQAK